MQDLDLAGLLDRTCRQAAALRVGDVMTTDLITIEPETHLLRVIDLMLKKHVRRLPVVEGAGFWASSICPGCLTFSWTGSPPPCRNVTGKVWTRPDGHRLGEGNLTTGQSPRSRLTDP